MADGPEADLKAALQRLDQGIPWAHHFDLFGVETISPERDNTFYRKAMGVKWIVELALHYCRTFSDARQVEGLRVLDLASAEGGYSIGFARAGAAEVVGVEGRQLYVDRANLVADAFGLENVRFVRSDVRKISAAQLGQFDFTMCAGILYHLPTEDFLPFLKTVGEMTRDLLFLYTHLSNDESIPSFRLVGPHEAGPELPGYLFREHPDDSTAEEKERQVRASLDNTFSFWPTEETLIRALKMAGFPTIVKVFEPHCFGAYTDRNLRVIFLAKKAVPPPSTIG